MNGSLKAIESIVSYLLVRSLFSSHSGFFLLLVSAAWTDKDA